VTTRAVFVINPTSDHGRTGKLWPQIASEARMRGLEIAERVTQEPGHATSLTRDALLAGEQLIVAVGGDGTVNEVVNGFCDDAGVPLVTTARLGVIERGTGCDMIRTYAIPKRVRDAVALLSGGRDRRIDLGQASYLAGGEAVSRMFVNVGSCGLTGDVARRANSSTKRFGGTASFLYATAAAFASWRNCPFSITIDGAARRMLVANNVICANGRYFGGAIRIAPDAAPDDGLFDVIMIGDVGKVDLALNAHRLYRGTLARHRLVEVTRAARIVVEPERQLPVEIDGEQPGTTPVTFQIVSGALRLVVP
jgi:diacylglycerol kinase (ATP)